MAGNYKITQTAIILACAKRWKRDRSAVDGLPIQEPGFFEVFDTLRPRIAVVLRDNYLAFLEDAYESWFLHVFVDRDKVGARTNDLMVDPVFVILEGPQKHIDRILQDPDGLLAEGQTPEHALALIPWSFLPDDVEDLPPGMLVEAIRRCGSLRPSKGGLPVPSVDDRLTLRDHIARTPNIARSRRILMIGISLATLGSKALEEAVIRPPGEISGKTPEIGGRATAEESVIRSCDPKLTVEAYSNPITAVRAFRR